MKLKAYLAIEKTGKGLFIANNLIRFCSIYQFDKHLKVALMNPSDSDKRSRDHQANRRQVTKKSCCPDNCTDDDESSSLIHARESTGRKYFEASIFWSLQNALNEIDVSSLICWNQVRFIGNWVIYIGGLSRSKLFDRF